MAKCGKCGQAVITTKIVCEKCQGRPTSAELESILQLICEQYCVHPYEAMDQEEMDEKCASCELAARIEALTAAGQEVDAGS